MNLEKFVIDFEKLYSKNKMLYNVHLLKHLADTVKQSGPLWAYSNFNFEDHNGILVNYINGTREVQKQICTKYMLHKYINFNSKSDTVQKFYEKTKNLKAIQNESGKLSLLGVSKKHKLTNLEKSIFINKFMINENKVISYNKIYIKGKVIMIDKKWIQTDDSIIKFSYENRISYGSVQKIFKIDEAIFMLVNKYGVLIEDDPIKHICSHLNECRITEEMILVEPGDIIEKCIIISTKFKKYITELPNKYERD